MINYSRHQMANDPRWRDIDSIDDFLALLVGISEGVEAIIVHARRFNILNPVSNFNEIRREAETIKKLLVNMKTFILVNRRLLEDDVRSGMTVEQNSKVKI